MTPQQQGFITILTGLYSLQDCVHFLASVRKFHDEPIVILVDRVPWLLYPLLWAFRRVKIQAAPSHPNPVLASRQAKLALYQASPFEKTIYLDSDICLMANINEVFDDLDQVDFLITEDVQPCIANASNLIRNKKSILHTLQAAGLPLNEASVQYNGGFMAFKKAPSIQQFFNEFHQYFERIVEHQDSLRLRDQGALAAAIASVNPPMKVLPPTYNFLTKWKNHYQLNLDEPIKVLHATYPYRPQYAKDITRSVYTRIFDKIASFLLPNQVKNPWRSSKADDVKTAVKSSLKH